MYGSPPPNRRTRIIFKEGEKIEARDHLGSRWWEAKVVEVDISCSEVLVHFIGWNERHDEWISMDSPRLQPAPRKTRRSSNNIRDSGDGSNPGSSLKLQEFKTGDEVMALWSKTKYPAKILRLESDGAYMIEYYDGIKKKLRPQFIRKISLDDLPFIEGCKEDLQIAVAGLNGDTTKFRARHRSNSSTDESSSVSEKGRRRKSKFSVKEIFNIQDKKPVDGKCDSPVRKTSESADSPKTEKLFELENLSVVKSSKNKLRTKSSELNEPKSESRAARNSKNSANLSDDLKSPPREKTVKGQRTEKESFSKLVNDHKQQLSHENHSLNDVKSVLPTYCDISPSSHLQEEATPLGPSPDTTPSPVKQPSSEDALSLITENGFGSSPKSEKGVLSGSTLLSEPEESFPSEPQDTSHEGTPSEKENLPSALLEPENSPTWHRKFTKDTPEGLGKRSRKRKRFADEEPESTGKKRPVNGQFGISPSISKSKSNRVIKGSKESISEIPSKSSILSPKKSKKNFESSSPANIVLSSHSSPELVKPLVESSKLSSPSPTEVLELPSNNNRDQTTSSSYPYLKFDISLPVDQLLKNMVEGFNIPGPAKPILVRAPKLPSGWTKKVSVRTNVLTSGKWEVVIFSPQGKSFKSKQELCRHFESNNLQLNIEDFDFLLDPALKKIRNIWKELKKTSQKPGIILPQVNPAPPLSSPDLGAEPSTEPGAKSNIEPVSESSPVIQPEPPVTSSPKEPPRNPLKTHEAVKMSPKPGGRSVETSPQSSRMGGAATQSPRMGGAATQSLPGGSGLVGWDGERGVRCNLVNCNKLFRNDKLLLQHVKHYHSHLNPILEELVGNQPTVTDMAYLRTRLGDDCKDLETGGELKDILRKAELKYEEGRRNKPVDKKCTPEAPPRPEKKRRRSPEEMQTEKKLKISNPSIQEESEISLEIFSPVPSDPPTPGPSLDTPIPDPALSTTPLSSVNKKGKGRSKRNSLHAKLQVNLKSINVESYRTPGSTPTPSATPGSSTPAATQKEPPCSAPPTPRATTPVGVPSTTGVPSTPGGTPTTWKRRPVRSPPDQGVETMSEEELVMCVCGKNEGDGMMIQCDVCLTWQHGICLSIYTEDQVPEYYICLTCRNPRLGRQSSLYNIPTYWSQDKSLPSLSPPRPSLTAPALSARERRISQEEGEERRKRRLEEGAERIEKLSRLMNDLSALSSVLHSLQAKLNIAEQKNHPKVFMWSAPWEESAPPLAWDTSAFLDSQGFNLDLTADFTEGVGGLEGVGAQGVGLEGVGTQGVGPEGVPHPKYIPDKSDPDNMLTQPDDKIKTDHETTVFNLHNGIDKVGARRRTVTFSDEKEWKKESREGEKEEWKKTGEEEKKKELIRRDREEIECKNKERKEIRACSNGNMKLLNGSKNLPKDEEVGNEMQEKTEYVKEIRKTELDDETDLIKTELSKTLVNGFDHTEKPELDYEVEKKSEFISKLDLERKLGISDVPEAESNLPGSSLNKVSGLDSNQTILDEQTVGSVDFEKTEDFSFFDFPSLKEVQELLPGVLKDISGMGLVAPPPGMGLGVPPPPTPTIIPQPKLINREESRINLVSHIQHVQDLLDERLDSLEARLDIEENIVNSTGGQSTATGGQSTATGGQNAISGGQSSLSGSQNTASEGQTSVLDCSQINQGLARILQDLRSIKKTSFILPENI